MGILKHLNGIFNRRNNNGSLFPELKGEHRVNPAFELNGVQYYEFDDAFSMCAGRAYSARDFYTELTMKVDRDYLKLHDDAVQERLERVKKNMVAKDGNLDLNEAFQAIHEIQVLHKQLRERCDMIVDPQMVLKMASVVYFDESENPLSYDYKYNLEHKIPQFAKHGGMDFFLSKPINQLMPFGDISKTDFQNYMKVRVKIAETHLEHLLSASSENSTKTEYFQILESWKNSIFPDLK